MKIPIFYFILLLFSSYSNVVRGIRKQVGNQFFDHYILAMQWPPYFGSNSTLFSIHGLWPQDSILPFGSPQPQFCTQVPFNLKVLSQVPNIATMWPSYGLPFAKFWEHEWKKHGTCSGLSQLDYFKLTIVLANKFDLAAVLQRGGVISNGHNLHVINDFISAFQATYQNIFPKVVCDKSGTQVLLQEFRFNYTNDDDTGVTAVLQSIVGTPYTPACGGTNVTIKY